MNDAAKSSRRLPGSSESAGVQLRAAKRGGGRNGELGMRGPGLPQGSPIAEGVRTCAAHRERWRSGQGKDICRDCTFGVRKAAGGRGVIDDQHCGALPTIRRTKAHPFRMIRALVGALAERYGADDRTRFSQDQAVSGGVRAAQPAEDRHRTVEVHGRTGQDQQVVAMDTQIAYAQTIEVEKVFEERLLVRSEASQLQPGGIAIDRVLPADLRDFG
jgi:hypothetical protein